MKLGRLTEEQVKRHEADPFGSDAALRNQFSIPDNRYFTVSIWPGSVRGFIHLDEHRTRDVKAKKISKSDQQ